MMYATDLISGDAEKWFDTSNYDGRRRKRPLTVEKNKNDRIDEIQEGW